MGKRLSITAWLLAILAAGLYVAYKASRVYALKAVANTTYTYNLLFKSSTWMILMAVLVGVLLATMTKRSHETEIRDGKVLRHDEVAFMEHWSHAASTLLLLATGVILGFLFVPRFAHTPQAVGFALNSHFVGVVIFMFGIAYYLTNTWLSGSMKEHMPEPGDLADALADYKAKMGEGKAPASGKYFASERLSYPGWIVLIFGIVLTGVFKVSAHVWDLPGWVMKVMTFFHDLSALGVLLYLGIHVMAAAVMPWSWPLLKSMLTGYVSEDYVRENHGKWYEELKKGGRRETPGKGGASKTLDA